ncbi:helix-turn-helix domain-containing protein [Streptomyces sp. NBC_01218]|uniref:helix-turn-helix domain-containing protein n=1 Tax=Streptomyces sp. NBC_01218 TaxID=2903780 RepID=UPI002E12E972|nr:helix-turn-helix domain-containing protein [Streptomyces sp. NBC_01218]
MTQQQGWTERYTQTVAAEVRRHRERRGMSAQDLADACAKLGVPIQRSVIANLENGRRASIGVAEVLVFAAALDVPPGVLMSPVGQTAEVEIFPGEMEDPYSVIQWIAGVTYRDGGTEGEHAGNPLPLYEELALLLADVGDLRERVESLTDITDRTRPAFEVLKAELAERQRRFDQLSAESDELGQGLASEDPRVSREALKETRKILDDMKALHAEMKAASVDIERAAQPFINLSATKDELAEAESDARRQIERIREQGFIPPRLPEDLNYLLDDAGRRRAKRVRRSG